VIMLLIKVKMLVFDDASHSKVVDDKKSWFTQMQLVDLIYRQLLITGNRSGRQLTPHSLSNHLLL